MNTRLDQLRRFQKCLRRATAASTPNEAEAAEVAARRLMHAYNIDPVKLGNKSLYDYTTFADNTVLAKLRAEYTATKQHKQQESRKAKAKTRTKHRLRQLVKQDDYECIRRLLNDGLSCDEVGHKLGYLSNTVNSVRYRYRKQGLWVVDSVGKLQWTTAGQPGG